MNTHFEMNALESRLLLSASLVKGTLTVTGTSGNDTITVLRAAPRSKLLAVNVNGQVSVFKAADVKHLVMIGGAGDDQLFIYDVNGTVGGTHVENGGDGNDTLSGDTANDTLIGMAGDDSLDGGAGNDLLDGGDGNDSLTGDGGNDLLEGQAGNDDCNGGTGRDSVIGGTGTDHFHGADDSITEIKDHGTDDTEDGGTDNGGHGGHDSIVSTSSRSFIDSMKSSKGVFAM